jgi:integrase
MHTPPNPTPAHRAAWTAAAAKRSAVNEMSVVVTVWNDGDHTASTLARLSDLATRFATRLHSRGVLSLRDATEADCESFVWAPTRRAAAPALHTVHLRRTALRLVYATVEQLDATVVDPTRRLPLPSRTQRRTRPLTDYEIVLVRTAALTRPRRPLRSAIAVALAEATATTGEIAALRWAAIDIAANTVHLPGATRVQPRTITLTHWGAGVIARSHAITGQQPDSLVIERHGSSTDSHVAQAAVTNTLAAVLRDAGLHDQTAKPGSIRLWRAKLELEAGGIQHAADSLGVSSLDAAAAALGTDHRGLS